MSTSVDTKGKESGGCCGGGVKKTEAKSEDKSCCSMDKDKSAASAQKSGHCKTPKENKAV